jgi:hypothetical protein
MSILRSSWLIAGSFIGLLLIMPTGCAVEGVGYSGSYGYSYGADYYEPFGFDYGGWGNSYYVGPYRSGGFRGGDHGSHAGTHAFRPAPGSHGVPSIPSGSRGGGHGGRGGRAGGGPGH